MEGGGPAFFVTLKARGVKCHSRINWTGLINDESALVDVYDRASIFVYPSTAKGETFGLAPLEAMSRGCLTVLSSLPCFQDFAEEGSNCLLFDHVHGNPVENLKRCLKKALSSENPEEMRTTARLTAESYRLPAIADLFLTDFQSILDSD